MAPLGASLKLALLLCVSACLAQEGAELRGPERFFHRGFFLQVQKGVVVTVFNGNGTGVVDEILLDGAAASNIGGSDASSEAFSQAISWKNAAFKGRRGALQLSGIDLKLDFKRAGKNFAMTAIGVNNAAIGSESVGATLNAKSKYGYSVEAPLGSAFCCDSMGMFAPKADKAATAKYTVGVTFPGMKLQVFDLTEPKFGPSWYCGEFLSIGVWVGLIITLLLAFVCYWGFSMLANIQTMDRFDDPKGKPIHVPQNE